MIENGTLLQNRYLIEKQIGAGGMGAVYLAVDQRFDSYVAIKETFYKDDELGEAFEREAKILNSLHHPNLPHVSDYFTEGGGHFLVMQFIEGEDLFDILKRDGAFPQTDVLRWTNNLLDALDYLHSQNPPVIHRDIKPQNLKITLRGDIILLDFGLAKLNYDDTQNALSVFGYSRKYSPLEQIQGTGTDARSDIFALGATMYHLLTGKPPVDVLARASAIVAGNPDPLVLANEINPEIPIDIANVLHSALALNAAARFVSAKAMRQALEHAVNLNLPEAPEELPEPEAVFAVPPENGKIVSAETENFPALEAFAAEAANVRIPQTDNKIDDVKAVGIPILNTQESSPAVLEVLPQSALVEEATKVSSPVSRPSKPRFSVAALILLLSCVGLATGYYITRANSSDELNQTPVTEQTAAQSVDSGAKQTQSDSVEPTPEISDASLADSTGQTKSSPVKTAPVVEKREANSTLPAEVSEKTKTVPDKSQPSQPSSPAAAKQTARRSQEQQNGETRERVAEAPVPDIEAVFTGRPSGAAQQEKMRRQQQRRQRNEMTEEEFQEFLRQRREQRRRRSNNNNFPF